LRKRIEIVLQVFKAASEKLTRVDREWQDVLDAQIYMLEEIISDATTKKSDRYGQTLLETAISDFQFTFNRAVDSLVSSDSNHSKAFMSGGREPIQLET